MKTRLAISSSLLAILVYGCGSVTDEPTSTSTSTTSTTTETGSSSCTPACAGDKPHCGPGGECVACRANGDCAKGEVCTGTGAAAACAKGCADDADCKAQGGSATSCCDGACVDVSTSATSCGACGHACAPANANPTCAGGVCVVDHCKAGYANCNGKADDGCEVDLTTDAENCLACGKACKAPGGVAACQNGCVVGSCAPGLADCNHDPADGCETDVSADLSNCGKCGGTCPDPPHASATCTAGACGMGACSGDYKDCNGDASDGCEADLGKDAANCGACGKSCGPDNYCWKGQCHLGACPAGKGDCNGNAADGCEASLASDPANCGACGTACPAPAHATAGCAAGACSLDACDAGYGNCNGAAADGCEADFSSDSNNCGACGNACGALKACKAGACVDQPVNLKSGLVDYWKLDGSLSPSVGGDAFVSGSGSPLYAGGKIGQAVGITNGPKYTNVLAVDLNKDVTVAFWANYLAHLADDNAVFQLGGWHISSHDVFGGKMGVFVQYDEPGNSGGGLVGGNLVLVDDSGFVPSNVTNTWYFVAVRRAGNTMTIRVNQKGTASVDVTGKTFAGNVHAYVGSQYWGYNFGGGVDEAGVWSRALSDVELDALYNGGQGTTLP